MNENNTRATEEKVAFSVSLNQLLSLTKMNIAIGRIAESLFQQAKLSIKENSSEANPAVLNQTLQFFEEEYQKEMPALITEIENLYKEFYTEDDIESVLEFYQTDVGQRFLRGGEQVEQRVQLVAQNWAQSAGTAAFHRATERVNSN